MSTILIIILLALIVFVAIVAMRPNMFRVSRTASFAAPASRIFPEINDFRRWHAWSPWARLDPTAIVTLEGAPSGAGSVMRWKGNHKVGEGNATITESTPDSFIRQRLEFIKPMKGVNTVEFSFDEVGGATQVTWTMFGPVNFIGKAMGVVMNCDKMCGDMFEQGFANLRPIVEA